MNLSGILKFTKLTHSFQQIERAIYATGENRKENDAEHSYQLAMVGWYIASSMNLKLDRDKVIKYGLLHDLVEVYAGDTQAFDKDPLVHLSKVDREMEALKQLKHEFNEFFEMTDLISTYELKDDEESKFIYALDKILPTINIYLDKGRSWQELNLNLEQIIEYKTPKVAAHPEIKKYFEELVEILKQDQQTLFSENHEKI
jgi:putative hydrolases of HD superfamily